MNKAFARKLITDPGEQTTNQLFTRGIPGVFWVDWREADEDIITSAQKIIGGDKLAPEWLNDKLHVKFRGKLIPVPLKFEPGEQYITLATLQQVVSPEYEIRYIKASEGGDTVAYMILRQQTLSELEAEYHAAQVAAALQKVDRASPYFRREAHGQATILADRDAEAKKRAQVLAEQQARIASADTLVRTKEGPKPIESIRVGDWVLSHPEDSDMSKRRPRPEHEYTYRQVIKAIVRDNQPISYVTYSAGGGRITALRLTPAHLIWTKANGWIPVAQLNVGHVLAIGYFGSVPVLEVQHTQETACVHTIEVDEFHTYFAGESAVWVHDASNTHKP